MSDYICSLCKQPAKPRLEYVGVVADCTNGCVEAPLLVWDDDFDDYTMSCLAASLGTDGIYRPITEQEEAAIADQIEDDQEWDAAEYKASRREE